MLASWPTCRFDRTWRDGSLRQKDKERNGCHQERCNGRQKEGRVQQAFSLRLAAAGMSLMMFVAFFLLEFPLNNSGNVQREEPQVF